MESYEQPEQGKWGQTHRWRATWKLVEVGGEEVEGLSKKDKRPMNMDNGVVIAGQGWVLGDYMVMGRNIMGIEFIKINSNPNKTFREIYMKK